MLQQIGKRSTEQLGKILLHYLEPVGGKFIFCCDFDLKILPIKLPAFYEECLKGSQNAPQQTTQVYRIKIDKVFQKLLCGTINLFVSGGKSVYFRNLAEKGILRMGDLISDNNELIVKSNYKLRELNISPLDIFRLISVIDDLLVGWCESLNTFASIADEPLDLHNEIKLSFNGNSVLIGTVFSKTVYIRNLEIESSLHRLPN